LRISARRPAIFTIEHCEECQHDRTPSFDHAVILVVAHFRLSSSLAQNDFISGESCFARNPLKKSSHASRIREYVCSWLHLRGSMRHRSHRCLGQMCQRVGSCFPRTILTITKVSCDRHSLSAAAPRRRKCYGPATPSVRHSRL
jgi:hypothetical protein